MKIKKIFATYGEERFRTLERQVARWLETEVSNSIISTGGGFFAVPNIKKIGTVLYLHAEFDQIIEAIHAHPKGKKKIRKRPLLQDLEKARALYEQRLPLYRATADQVIEVGGRTIEEVCDEIMQRL